MNLFTPFTKIVEPVFGGKANNLGELLSNGFNVPDGFVISAKKIESANTKQLDEIIVKAWDFTVSQFGDGSEVAVRSSVNMEDGPIHSFAGQFSSYLSINNLASFNEAVLNCVASKQNPNATAYCKQKGLNPDDLEINVIVQKMVLADYSGVCFTVNPMSGKAKELVIESVAGSGKKLVEGITTPSNYIVNWYHNKITSKTTESIHNLTPELLKNITESCLAIQQHYGTPQDIEWCLLNGEFYTLQSRPLTTIKFETEFDWTNADLKDGGIASEITTPLMYSLYENAFEGTMPPYLKSVKIHPPYKPSKWFTQFLMYSYWNLSALKDGAKKIPGFIEKEFDNDLGITPNYTGNGHVTKLGLKNIIQGISILFAIKKQIAISLNNAPQQLKDFDELIKEYSVTKWNELDFNQLTSSIHKLLTSDYPLIEGGYFKIIYDNSNNTTLFKDAFNKTNKTNGYEYLKLIAGIQGLSHLKPSFEVWELSRLIRKDANAVAFFNGTSTEELVKKFRERKEIPFKKKIDAIIGKYAYHSEKELNLLTPNWDQNPAQIYTSIKHFIAKEDRESIIVQNNEQLKVYENELAKVKSNSLKKKIVQHRQLLWLREEFKDRSTQLYHIIQKAALALGNELSVKGILSKNEDIFFLDLKQILNITTETTDAKNTVSANKIIFKSFRNFDRPNEVWRGKQVSKPLTSSNSTFLEGIPCSQGVVEGDIYIASTIKEAEQMPMGKIMVTKFTDPAWTMYFPSIVGLITETGGLLSHGAIISREYGVPAVLAVQGAIGKLKNGTKVVLNGSDGTIEIIDQ
jgi:phosphohistidine swiveling domain-containing protein